MRQSRWDVSYLAVFRGDLPPKVISRVLIQRNPRIAFLAQHVEGFTAYDYHEAAEVKLSTLVQTGAVQVPLE